MTDFEQFCYDQKMQQARREYDESVKQVCGNTYAQLAGSAMMVAFLHPDPKASADSMARALDYQMKSALAYAGAPTCP